MRRAIGIGLVLLCPSLVHAQPPPSGCTPRPDEIKARALKLRAEYPGDTKFSEALDKSVGFEKYRLSKDILPPHGIILSHAEDITLLISPPYWRYKFGLLEAIRKRADLEIVPLADGVTVAISPSRLDAPDIVKVILERDGQTVTPLMNALKPTPMETRLGAKAILHSGFVTYPCSAFTPGAKVTLTLIPESNSNIVRTFSELEIQILGPHQMVEIVKTPPPAEPVSTLSGMTADAVREKFGSPSISQNTTWYYDTGDHGTLQIFFRRDAAAGLVVSSALPNDFDLAWMQKK
jgi:hypothetical protein